MPAPPRRLGPRLGGALLALAVGLSVAAYGPGERLLTERGASAASTAAAPSASATASGTGGASGTASPTPSPTPTGTLDVVGLGDSVTSGEHCSCDDYVTAFGALLHKATGRKVDTRNDGESGSTSVDLADDLAGDHGVRHDVSRADIVVVTIGANDLSPALGAWRSDRCPAGCYDPLVATMSGHLARVLDRLSDLGVDHDAILVTTYWNVFADGDVAKQQEDSGYLRWSDTVTKAANHAICATVQQAGDRCVDLYSPFKGDDGGTNPTRLLASDGDHPDSAGTTLISTAVLAAYERGR